MDPKKLSAFVPHTHKPSKARILLLQERVKLTQNHSVRPDRFAPFRFWCVAVAEPASEFLARNLPFPCSLTAHFTRLNARSIRSNPLVMSR